MSDSPQADKTANPDINDSADDATTEAVESEEGRDLQAELDQAQAKIQEYWEEILRNKAEQENHRKRATRDLENAHKYALSGFAEALLPICDSLELGLNAAQQENATLDSIKEGMSMTGDMLLKVMQKHGVEQIDPTGEPFNPEQHQAMSMQADAEAAPNTVLAVMQKGYLLNQRLVRPAMVVVSKKPD